MLMSEPKRWIETSQLYCLGPEWQYILWGLSLEIFSITSAPLGPLGPWCREVASFASILGISHEFFMFFMSICEYLFLSFLLTPQVAYPKANIIFFWKCCSPSSCFHWSHYKSYNWVPCCHSLLLIDQTLPAFDTTFASSHTYCQMLFPNLIFNLSFWSKVPCSQVIISSTLMLCLYKYVNSKCPISTACLHPDDSTKPPVTSSKSILSFKTPSFKKFHVRRWKL